LTPYAALDIGANEWPLVDRCRVNVARHAARCIGEGVEGSQYCWCFVTPVATAFADLSQRPPASTDLSLDPPMPVG
jgi:hypothetical protein